MVKGISRQVIVVHAPEPKLFEQAIFILKEDALGQEGITDEVLMEEARRLIRNPQRRSMPLYCYGTAWACAGAMATGLLWLVSALF
jgi:hypothetical protein